jgi:SAM-dependent methyltransferase
MSTTGYAIRGGTVGRDRLRVLSSVLESTTRALLDRVGIARDARCIDVGCGGGDVTALLAAMASGGTVVGTDRDAVKIELAGLETAQFDNVELRVEDVATTVERDRAAYDVVFVRFLLSHLHDPGQWVQRLAGLLRPGGAMIVEDIRLAGSFCSPASATFDRALEIYRSTVRANGGNAEVGPHLPTMLLAAGLAEIGIEVVQPAALTGGAKQIQLLTLRAIEASAVAAGISTPDEMAGLGGELEELVERRDTVVSTAQIVQTWGRYQPD